MLYLVKVGTFVFFMLIDDVSFLVVLTIRLMDMCILNEVIGLQGGC